MPTERHIVIVGGGRTGEQILRRIPERWRVTVIDPDTARLEALSGGERALTPIAGDASSRLVLARAGLDATSTLVVATPDDAVNAEVGRLARADFGVEDVILLDNDGVQADLPGTVVDRSHAAAAPLVEQIGGAATTSGRGELSRVTVLAGSPAIGRRLRDFKRGDWLVAMVYRGDKLLVPHGDAVLDEGDRVLLAGDPAELGTVSAYFRGGDPTFPAAWGSRIAVAGPEAAAAARWLAARTTAHEVIEIPGLLTGPNGADIGARVRAEDVGCVVVPARPIAWAARVGFARSDWPDLLLRTGVPVLVARGTSAPERVVAAVGPAGDPNAITGPAIDLARQAGIPLVLLTVLPPSVSPDADAVTDLTAHALRFARLHGLEPKRLVETGNPIARVRAVCRPTDLLVLGHAPATRNTLFTPDISLFLLHEAPGPTLFVPRAPAVG